MLPDRVVAYRQNVIKGLNLYTLGQIFEACDSVRGVTAEWLQPKDSDIPFRVEWGVILNKFFKNLPAGYTSNYFYEFERGFVTFRRLATCPDAEATSVRLIEASPDVKHRLLVSLFGNTDKSTLKMLDLTLPAHAGNTLAKTKVKSLAKKYFSIGT